MSKVKCVYLIKRVTSTWDGCNGCTSETDYLNWVFGARDRAEKKCDFFNKEYGGKSTKKIFKKKWLYDHLFCYLYHRLIKLNIWVRFIMTLRKRTILK